MNRNRFRPVGGCYCTETSTHLAPWLGCAVQYLSQGLRDTGSGPGASDPHGCQAASQQDLFALSTKDVTQKLAASAVAGMSKGANQAVNCQIWRLRYPMKTFVMAGAGVASHLQALLSEIKWSG